MCGFLLSSNLSAAPPAFEANYRVFYGKTEIGIAKRSLRYDGAQYRIASLLQPQGLAALFMGSINESAEGQVIEDRLHSEHYFFDRSDRPKKRRDFTLDWVTKQLHNATGPDYALAEGAIDALSMQAQLMDDLSPAHTSLHYATIGRNGMDPFNFSIRAGEDILVADQSYPTLHLLREKNGDRFEIWVAPTLNYFPVRILRTEDDGKSFRLDLQQPPQTTDLQTSAGLVPSTPSH